MCNSLSRNLTYACLSHYEEELIRIEPLESFKFNFCFLSKLQKKDLETEQKQQHTFLPGKLYRFADPIQRKIA